MSAKTLLLMLISVVVVSAMTTNAPSVHKLPDGFTYLWRFYEEKIKPIKPHLKPVGESLRYATVENFNGVIVPGYHAGKSRVVLTEKAAAAVYTAQESALAKGYSLLIYDAYRPQRAVDFFYKWATEPESCAKCKANYYPHLSTKLDAFKEPDVYVASKSRHSGGSTMDLTIIGSNLTVHHPPTPIARHLLNNQTVNYLFDNSLDMYTSFDLMDRASWPEGHSLVPSHPYLENRQILQKIMSDAGFQQYEKEWWHFTLRGEPFPDKYFDFEF